MGLKTKRNKTLTCVVVRLPDVFPGVLCPGQRDGEQEEAQQVFTGNLPHDDDDGENLLITAVNR